MENRLSEKLNALQIQNEFLISEMKRLTNHYEQNSLEIPEQEYPERLKEWFSNISGGKVLNLASPKTFNDKLNWLKIYDRNPIKSILSDKYLAPRYVSYITGRKLKTTQCLGVWENAYDINFGLLPKKFVLKCNHGSSMNIIVSDKTKLDISFTIKRLNEWLNIDYTKQGGCFELQYQDIKRRIIAEEFLDDGNPSLRDYKIHCFNGEPKLIQVIGNRDTNSLTHEEVFFDTTWKKQPIKKFDSKLLDNNITRPQKLDEMLKFASFLSKDFIYVRIDFYYVNDEIYFGEYTFSPAAGYFNFENEKNDVELGELMNINERLSVIREMQGKINDEREKSYR